MADQGQRGSVISTLSENEALMIETRKNVKSLENAFVEKVPELVSHLFLPEVEDPLGIYSEDQAQQQKEKVQSKAVQPPRRRPRRRVQEDIFRDFGKEHDKSAVHEIEVGGLVITRANFKRFWQSDKDLRRWQQALGDTSRNDRLWLQVRQRCHPERDIDQTELLKHAVAARQRNDATERPPPNCAQQLKDLQKQLRPKEAKPRKNKRFDFAADYPFHNKRDGLDDMGDFQRGGLRSGARGMKQREEQPPNESEEAVLEVLELLMRNSSTLEEAFDKLDRNGNGVLSMAEFTTSLRDMGYRHNDRLLFKLLEKDNDGWINRREFMNLNPYFTKALEDQRFQAKQLGAEANSRRASAEQWDRAEHDDDGQLEPNGGYKRSDANSMTSGFDSPSSYRRRQSLGTEGSFVTDGRATEAHTELVSEASPRSAHNGRLLKAQQEVPQKQQQHLKGRPRLPQMPPTLALLLYKNADRLHSGETVFVPKWPLPSLKDLLAVCGKACRPIVPPAQALFKADLSPVRSIEEVRSGSIYLLKGLEALNPPPLFFSQQEPHLAASFSAPSLRALHSAKEAAAADQEVRSAPSMSQMMWTSQTRGSGWSLSQASTTRRTAESPPWPSEGLPPSIKLERKWQVDNKLAGILSWGGLGQPHRHHKYETWGPVLGLHQSQESNSIDQSIHA